MSNENKILVLRIIDDYTLVVNVGSDHGIKKSTIFSIFYRPGSDYRPKDKRNTWRT